MQSTAERPEQAERPERPERAERTTGANARATASPDVATAGDVSQLVAPRTAAELEALTSRRDGLNEQLVATHSRRRELQEEMRQTDAGAQDVLRQQMTELDRRVLQMEKDVSTLDHLIATAPTALAAETSALNAIQVVQPRGLVLFGPNGPSANAVPALLLLITLLQIVLLVRSRVRRTPLVQADAVTRESAARLARVEQAVEAIAIEVERVSEGQRFVTRLLGEQQSCVAHRAPAPAERYTTSS